MRVIFSSHALKRMRESRQNGIGYSDIKMAAKKIENAIGETRIKNNKAKSGRFFDIVVSDKGFLRDKKTRIIVTVIGLKY